MLTVGVGFEKVSLASGGEAPSNPLPLPPSAQNPLFLSLQLFLLLPFGLSLLTLHILLLCFQNVLHFRTQAYKNLSRFSSF